MSDTDRYRRLVRFENGAVDVLWEDSAGYDAGHPHDLAVAVRDGQLRGYLDGTPMFAVHGSALPGRVGLYCAGNDQAGFSGVQVYPAETAEHPWLLDERFLPGRPARWAVVDVGDVGGPSAWSTDAGGLRQASSLHGGSADPDDPAKPGTLALLDDGWGDQRASAVLSTGGPGAIGVVFRYADPGNHYRFSMDSDMSYRRLVRIQDGACTVLWEDGGATGTGRDYLLTIDAVGDLLSVALDGSPLCTVIDAAHQAGRIGLYCWWNPAARFREVRVAAPEWVPWCTLGDEPLRSAGAVVRIHAGANQAGLAEPGWPDGLDHRYAAGLDDRGRLTLSRSRADLRLRDPAGKPGHTCSFLPPDAYADVPIRVLRKADGTGIALFPAAGPLQPGHHRLHLEFRRDNRAVDAGSTVLRCAGSTAAELVDLEIPWRSRPG